MSSSFLFPSITLLPWDLPWLATKKQKPPLWIRQDNSVVALTPPGKDDSNRVPNGAGSSSRRPEAPASPEPEVDRDGDPAELTERGQLRLGELEGLEPDFGCFQK